jgi:ABC-2 type transport system permease protein
MTAPSLVRLIRVEMRKTRDTRAGFWLLLILGLLGVAVVVLLLFAGKPAELTFETYLYTTQLPLGILLPVLGILAVTSEWSQRTALTTFTLVPRRSRIMTAKALGLVLLALLAVVATVVAAALGNLISRLMRDADGSWGDVPSMLGRVALFQVLAVLVGVGLGMLLLSAPQAIVTYLLFPTLLTALASLIPFLRAPALWLDLAGTTTRLLGEELTGRAWTQIAVSFGLWALLPLLLGAVRISRREVQ